MSSLRYLQLTIDDDITYFESRVDAGRIPGYINCTGARSPSRSSTVYRHLLNSSDDRPADRL